VPEKVAGAGLEPESHSLAESIAAGIAHEVRNPLNALQINLGILEQELSGRLRHGVSALRPAAAP